MSLRFLKSLYLLPLVVIAAGEFGDSWGTAEREAAYYRLVNVPMPEGVYLEAGSFVSLPDGRLAVGTRRGEILLFCGVGDENPSPKASTFASGLDEVLGLAWHDGAFYATHATEVTRIADTNGDGRADRYDTVSDAWGFGHYHEFALGSKFDTAGNLYVALGLSESYHSKELFRGWALKITPEGRTIPLCSGLRSPLGVGPNEHGEMFYVESQGPWNGSCSLKHLKPGGFMGHPISFNWYPFATNMGPAPVMPDSPSRMEVERKRVKELVPYAVVFPYKKMGRSISAFEVCRAGGKFGPFENQIFVGDYSLSVVMRVTTELVNGVWQGACYPFREGLGTGILAVHFTPDGKLIAGGTNRGWPVRGMKDNLLQRLEWTGKTPFEILDIRAQPDGFVVRFTRPVDAALAARPESYELQTYTHIYQQGYGSPEVDHTRPTVAAAEVAADGSSVRLRVKGLVQGHVHDFHLRAFKSRNDEPLLHDRAYYTLNEIPK
jgi:glucose/arabinose dehydrogenase